MVIPLPQRLCECWDFRCEFIFSWGEITVLGGGAGDGTQESMHACIVSMCSATKLPSNLQPTSQPVSLYLCVYMAMSNNFVFGTRQLGSEHFCLPDMRPWAEQCSSSSFTKWDNFYPGDGIVGRLKLRAVPNCYIHTVCSSQTGFREERSIHSRIRIKCFWVPFVLKILRLP